MSEPQQLPEASAAEEIARIIGAGPYAQARLGDGIRLQRWRHGALHDETQAMADHVFMTYSGPVRRIERRRQSRWDRSVTRPDHVTLIPAGDIDRWDIEGDIEACHLYIGREVLHETAATHEIGWTGTLAPRTATPDRLGAQLVHVLSQASCGPARADRLLIDHLTQALLHYLLREHGYASVPEQPARGGLAPCQVKRAIDLMHGRLAEGVPLAELAAAAGLSTFHFARAFRRSTGLAPHQFLSQLRLDEAQRLVARTDLPLAAVAAQIGYADPGYFARAFRRRFGTTPSRYRRDGRS